jgi:triosephosphate isomerase
VVNDVETADKKCFTKINELVKNCDAQHIPVIGITHSDYKAAESFRHDVQAAFPFYTAGDDKFVKTMVRCNPGIMLMKKGTVIKKWHYRDAPSYAEAMHSAF